MKIKKVEISAFRIYDDPKDATFDLTTQAGKVADFVSLYAPNGFGKTSFYDAVEFGITSSINRFFIRSKEVEKLANFQHNQNDLSLIRNTKSPYSRKTYVKITDNEGNKKETPLVKRGRQRHDLLFDRPIVHSFQKVILSQEWISAFLTEQNGEYRYKKFMEVPELSYINNYYNKVKQLYTSCVGKREELKNEISKLEATAQNITSENILDVVNQQIQLLTNTYKQSDLVPFTLATTREEIKKFKDCITNKYPSNIRESELTQLLNYINIAKSGNDTIVGGQRYFAIIEELVKSKSFLSEKRSVLEKFKKLEYSKTEQINIKSTLKKYIDNKTNLSVVTSYYGAYEDVAKKLENKRHEINNHEKNYNEALKEIGLLNQASIDKNSSLKTLVSQIEEFTTTKGQLPQIRTEFELLETQIEQFNIALEEKKNLSIRQSEEAKKLSQEISKTNSIIKDVAEDKYSQPGTDENPIVKKCIQALEENNHIINKEKETLVLQDRIIQQQVSLNETITEFVKQGMSITEERHSTVCPLCEHVYDSYNALVEKIANNNALDETLKTLFAQKNATESRIYELTNKINEEKTNLTYYYQNQLTEQNKKHNAINATIENIKKRSMTLLLN